MCGHQVDGGLRGPGSDAMRRLEIFVWENNEALVDCLESKSLQILFRTRKSLRVFFCFVEKKPPKILNWWCFPVPDLAVVDSVLVTLATSSQDDRCHKSESG